MDNNATLERIKEQLRGKGITAKQMLSDLGLSPTYLVNLKNAKYVPNKLPNIAAYLGVSVDYLLGAESPADEEQVDDRYIQLVNAVRRMTPEQVDAWLSLLESQRGGQ